MKPCWVSFSLRGLGDGLAHLCTHGAHPGAENAAGLHNYVLRKAVQAYDVAPPTERRALTSLTHTVWILPVGPQNALFPGTHTSGTLSLQEFQLLCRCRAEQPSLGEPLAEPSQAPES